MNKFNKWIDEKYMKLPRAIRIPVAFIGDLVLLPFSIIAFIVYYILWVKFNGFKWANNALKANIKAMGRNYKHYVFQNH